MAESIEELRSNLDALHEEIVGLAEAEDITPEQDARLDEAISEEAELRAKVEKAEKREAKIDEIRKVEAEGRTRPAVEPFNVNTRDRDSGQVFDETTLRYDTSENLRARALTALEKHLPPDVGDGARESATRLVQSRRQDGDILRRHVIRTSDPRYLDAFERHMENPQGALPDILSDHSARTAMSLTAANGGVLIPQYLDPTINLTNAGITDPLRRVSSIAQITVDQWDGVTSAGVTAEWLAEGAQAADATPTFVGPTITPAKEAAWIFGSYEALADSGFDQQAMLFADAFERLEGAAHITGTGSGQPYGLVTQLSGTGPVVAGSSGAAGAADFAKADAYALDNALGPRWRQNATWTTSQYFGNVIRQAVDSLTNYWQDFGAGMPSQLIGYDLLVCSTMAVYPAMGAVGATTITSGSNDYPLILGDHKMYQMVDRVGVSVIYEPLIKSTGNNRPTGQAGWFAFKRHGADVLTSNAFKTLKL